MEDILTCAIVCCSLNNKWNYENTILNMLQWTKENKFGTTVYCSERFLDFDELIVKQHVLDTDLMVFDLLLFPNPQESKSFYRYHQQRILESNLDTFHNYFVRDMDQKIIINKRREYILRFPKLINIFTMQLPEHVQDGYHFIVCTDSEIKNTFKITYLPNMSLENQHIICACCDYTTSETLSYNCLTPLINIDQTITLSNFDNLRMNKYVPKFIENKRLTKNPFHFTLMHQVWLSNNPIRPNNMYHDHNQVKWKTMNPEITFKLWHKLDVIDLIKTHYNDKTLECFQSLTPIICQCDFARLLIVYTFGGLYTDVDFIPIKPIKQWCPTYDLSGFLLFAELSEHSTTQLCNGFFGSENPGHPYLKALIDHIIENKTSSGDVMAQTGPKLWSKLHLKNFQNMIVQNGAYVMPITDHHILSQDFDPNHACWAYTDWDAGSGWGSGVEHRNIVIDKTNQINLMEITTTDAWFIVLLIEIIFIVVMMIIWIAIEFKINRTFSKPVG
jgi:mannosyltransferase OCH1-like enzyme